MNAKTSFRLTTLSLALAAGLGILGCAGGSAANGLGMSGGLTTGSTAASGTSSTPAGTSRVQVSLGDAPSDWIVAFGMTVDSISLTTASGSTVSVAPASSNLEVMQLMGAAQPVSAPAVPQGTYTQAMVTFSNVSMGYIDPVTHAYAQKAMAGPYTATVPFSPSLTVGASPMALNFDMDMASSVSIDGAGNVSLTPVMTAAAGSVPASGQTPWTGAMQHQVGTVSSVGNGQFSIGSMMGIPSATFSAGQGTAYSGTGLSGISGLSSGMMVAVDAALQADGTYMATRVQSMGAGQAGMMGGGLVTAVTGSPATQMNLSLMGGMGGGMMASSIARTATVALPSTAVFAYDADGIDLTNLPFTPAFGPSNLAAGQRVEAVSQAGMMSGGMMGGLGTLSASQVTLEPQGLHGAVSNYVASGSQATFTLSLPTDSAFASLTGLTSVQVYQQAGTTLQGLASVANGTYLNVRGLLFYDGTAYRMVAGLLEPGASFTQAPAASGSTSSTNASASLQIALGDAPADWLMAFGMKVESITFTTASGTTVNVAPTGAAMEMTQLMAGTQAVSALAVPQGTYTQAAVTLSSISMGYLDPSTKAYTQKNLAGPYTATVPFAPALTVGSGPMALDFDLDLAASITQGGSGSLAVNPVMRASAAPVASGSVDPWAGGMQHQVGTVTNAFGSSFTLGSMMGIQAGSFQVDASTQFTGAGLAAMGGLNAGMMVDVDAVLQADGTYLARRVEAMGPGATGMMGGGIVTGISGNPPSQLTLAMTSGMGGGMMASDLGGTVAVTLAAATPWTMDADGVDLTGLSFTPAFGPATVSKGQRVEVVSGSAMMAAGGMMGSGTTRTLAASQVRLEPQGLAGTVSGYASSGSQANFTLTLAADSAFSALTGTSTVQVYQQGGTVLHGLGSVANGETVDVRGLVFFDGTTYRLVAGWMAAH